MQASPAMRTNVPPPIGLKDVGDDAQRSDLEVLTFDLSGEVFAIIRLKKTWSGSGRPNAFAKTCVERLRS